MTTTLADQAEALAIREIHEERAPADVPKPYQWRNLALAIQMDMDTRPRPLAGVIGTRIKGAHRLVVAFGPSEETP